MARTSKENENRFVVVLRNAPALEIVCHDYWVDKHRMSMVFFDKTGTAENEKNDVVGFALSDVICVMPADRYKLAVRND